MCPSLISMIEDKCFEKRGLKLPVLPSSVAFLSVYYAMVWLLLHLTTMHNDRNESGTRNGIDH
jgi:hypothetical protein